MLRVDKVTEAAASFYDSTDDAPVAEHLFRYWVVTECSTGRLTVQPVPAGNFGVLADPPGPQHGSAQGHEQDRVR